MAAHHIELGKLNNNEREPIQRLCNGLPSSWIIFTSVSSIPGKGRGKNVPEVDCLIFGNSHIFVVELKAFAGPVRVYKGQPWEDASGQIINERAQGQFGYWNYHEIERVYAIKDLLVAKLQRPFPEFDKKVVYGKILLTGIGARIDLANSDSTLTGQVHNLGDGIGKMLEADTFEAEIALDERLTRAIINCFLTKFPNIPSEIFELRESRARSLKEEWAQKAREQATKQAKPRFAGKSNQSNAGNASPPPPPPPSGSGGSFQNTQKPLHGSRKPDPQSRTTQGAGTATGSQQSSGGFGGVGGSNRPQPGASSTRNPVPPHRTSMSPHAKANHELWKAMAKWGAMAGALVGVWWFAVARACNDMVSECSTTSWYSFELKDFDLLFLASASATYFVALFAIHRGTK